MKNYDESVKINHNPDWSYIPDHPYRILIIGGSGSRDTNALLNLIKHQRTDIDKIYDMIAGMESCKKLSPIVTELLFKRKKTQCFTCFYFRILL